MIDFILDIDQNIFLFLNGHHTPFLDSFMYMFSGKWIWAPFYAALLTMIWKSYGTARTAAIVAGVVALIFLADQTCATLIRPVVQRLRPSNPDNAISSLVHIVNGHRGGAYGFPSCHAANTFALATFMSLLGRTPRLSRMLFAWAIVTCYSRIYLGVHFTGDLVAGGVIGSAFAFAVYSVVKYTVLREGYRDTRPSIIFAYSPDSLSPILSVKTINFRYSDAVSAVGLATVIYIVIASL